MGASSRSSPAKASSFAENLKCYSVAMLEPRTSGGRWLSWISLGAAAAIWETAGRAGAVNPVLFSTPCRIFAEGWRMAASPSLWSDCSATFSAFGGAFILSLVLGTALGMGMAASRFVERIVNPYVVGLNAVPKIALMPLVVLWFGLGWPSKLCLGTLMGAFPVIVAVFAAVKGLERDYVLLARAYGASPGMILRKVLLPGVLPAILASSRVALNYALVGVLIVEFFASDSGIGHRMIVASSDFRVDSFFVLLLLLMAFALALTEIVFTVEKRFMSWRTEALG